jgi:hypothetical protein
MSNAEFIDLLPNVDICRKGLLNGIDMFNCICRRVPLVRGKGKPGRFNDASPIANEAAWRNHMDIEAELKSLAEKSKMTVAEVRAGAKIAPRNG